MNKHYNSSSSLTYKVGGGLPFLVDPQVVRYRVGGFEVKNSLDEGELIHAGTPMQITVADHEAKILKCWKVKSVTADASAGTTTIEIFKTAITPVLKAATVIMVAPSTVAGTGKAVAAGTVSTNSSGNYEITVTTSAIDSVTANAILVEAAEAGSGKAMYCKPNSITCEDVVAGGNYTHEDSPWGILYAYDNTINPMPDAVKTAIGDGSNGLVIAWDKFNETNS